MTRDSSALLVFLPFTSCLSLQHGRAQYVRHFNSFYLVLHLSLLTMLFFLKLSLFSFTSLSFSAHTFKMLGQV